MREFMLILHFIGLAMGVGTSFAFMFLGSASSKMQPEKGQVFMLDALALSRMGQIGLVLLLVSGGYLMTPYWSILTSSPLLMLKLVLFLVLAAFIGIITSLKKKALKGDATVHMKKISILGRFSLITAWAIVVLAVVVFK